MSTQAYTHLLRAAFRTDADATRYLNASTLAAYATFERAPNPDLPYRFERVRLAVAMALLKLLADLGDNEESRRVLDVLHQALRAPSVADIDTAITREAKLFERLYTNLYVNDQGEQLLNLFERTLDSDTKPLMDAVITDAIALAEELDFDAADEDEDDEEA